SEHHSASKKTRWSPLLEGCGCATVGIRRQTDEVAPMRIALISSPWLPVPPPGYGGTEAVLDTLARGLRASGEDVLLCAPGDSTCPVPIAPTRSRSAGTDAVGAAGGLAHA